MSNRTFIAQAERIISADPNHPLKLLIDPNTHKFWGKTAFADVAEAQPTVQAGHTMSRFAGGQRLAIQDAYSNWLEGLAEAKWHVSLRETVDIGGVPVERGTALLYERLGVIPSGTTAYAQPCEGWQPGDKLVSKPWDGPRFPIGPTTESLPGGADGTVTLTGVGMSKEVATLLEGMSSWSIYAAIFGVTLGMSDLVRLPARDTPSPQAGLAGPADPTPGDTGGSARPAKDPDSQPRSSESKTTAPGGPSTQDKRTYQADPKRVLVYSGPATALQKAARDAATTKAAEHGGSLTASGRDGAADQPRSLAEAAAGAAKRKAAENRGHQGANAPARFNPSGSNPPLQFYRPQILQNPGWRLGIPGFPRGFTNPPPMPPFIPPPMSFAPSSSSNYTPPPPAPPAAPSIILPSWIWSPMPTPTAPPPTPPTPLPQFIYTGPPLSQTLYVNGSTPGTLFMDPGFQVPFR